MNKSSGFRVNKPLALLSAAHAVTDLSSGALPALLPFIKSSLDLSYAQIGFIVLTQNITSSVIQPLFGYMSDKITIPWLIPFSVALSGVGTAAAGFMNSYITLLAVIIFSGMGIAAFHPQASRSANLVSSNASKGRSMGTFSVGGNLGAALGSIFIVFLVTREGGLNNTIYFLIPAISMALILLRNVTIIAPSIQPAVNTSCTTVKQPASLKSTVPYKAIIILLGFVFVRSTVHTGLSTYIPLYYLNQLSGNPLYAGYLLSAFLGAGVLGTYTGGIVSDRLGRKTVLLFSMLSSIPLIFLFQFSTGILSVIIVAITGATLISSFAATLLLAHELMPNHLGMASGLTIGFSIGLGGIGTTILGVIADHFGIAMIFSLLTFLPLIGFVLTFLLPGKIGKPSSC